MSMCLCLAQQHLVQIHLPQSRGESHVECCYRHVDTHLALACRCIPPTTIQSSSWGRLRCHGDPLQGTCIIKKRVDGWPSSNNCCKTRRLTLLTAHQQKQQGICLGQIAPESEPSTGMNIGHMRMDGMKYSDSSIMSPTSLKQMGFFNSKCW